MIFTANKARKLVSGTNFNSTWKLVSGTNISALTGILLSADLGYLHLAAGLLIVLAANTFVDFFAVY